MNREEGIFWYSEKQGNLSSWHNYCTLDNGKVVEYTEWKNGEWLNDKSNWDDAICLGHGVFHHHQEGNQ